MLHLYREVKYIIIPIIALGFTLGSLFGVEYTCQGHEMFPNYFGSPFIFMRENLGSSMEYFYSISGILLNVIVWSIPLFALHYLINKSINTTSNPKLARVFYYSFVDVFLLFALLNVHMTTIFIGSGFDKHANYWYFTMDKDANDYGLQCEGEWKFIQFF